MAWRDHEFTAALSARVHKPLIYGLAVEKNIGTRLPL